MGSTRSNGSNTIKIINQGLKHEYIIESSLKIWLEIGGVKREERFTETKRENVTIQLCESVVGV